MGASASFAIDFASRDIATLAARWVAGFYPRVAISIDTAVVTLSSEHHQEPDLAAIWASALANERLMAAAGAERTAAFVALAE